MKKSMILGVALGLAALTGIGWVGVATAQEGYRNNDNREWREDGYRGDRDRDDNQGWRNGENRGYGNRGYGNSARAFIGTWRLDERRNRRGWNSGFGSWNGGLGSMFTQLPSVIRIERERRELRVENARGRLLREIDLRGGDARDGQFQVVSTGFGGARVVETFTLRGRGRELVVHTTVHARRGATRQFTSIYDRA